jgi:hypothetical protein
MNSRRLILATLILFALAAADLVCYWEFSESQSYAFRAIHDADKCGQMAARIILLRSKPTLAGAVEQAPEELARRIESTANALGIEGDNLASIEPDPAVRVADTSYLEKPTTVQLRQVTLAQLIDLLCGISESGQNLQIKALRLTSPPHEDEGGRWSAELTVTYLIYSPQSARTENGERS